MSTWRAFPNCSSNFSIFGGQRKPGPVAVILQSCFSGSFFSSSVKHTRHGHPASHCPQAMSRKLQFWMRCGLSHDCCNVSKAPFLPVAAVGFCVNTPQSFLSSISVKLAPGKFQATQTAPGRSTVISRAWLPPVVRNTRLRLSTPILLAQVLRHAHMWKMPRHNIPATQRPSTRCLYIFFGTPAVDQTYELRSDSWCLSVQHAKESASEIRWQSPHIVDSNQVVVTEQRRCAA